MKKVIIKIVLEDDEKPREEWKMVVQALAVGDYSKQMVHIMLTDSIGGLVDKFTDEVYEQGTKNI